MKRLVKDDIMNICISFIRIDFTVDKSLFYSFVNNMSVNIHIVKNMSNSFVKNDTHYLIHFTFLSCSESVNSSNF